MARRLALTAVVFLELVAAAVIAVALRYGRFDQGVGFFLYLAGPLAALSIAAGVTLPTNVLRRASAHVLLLLGCVVFALPFVWLVSTSFKYEEEIFVYPPKWIPSTPGVVLRSPYISKEGSVARARIERPSTLTPARWRALWPQMREAFRRRGVELLGQERDALSVRDPAAVDALADGLWNRAARGVPDAAWEASDRDLLTAVPGRVQREDAEAVWDSIRRSLQFGEITFTDDEGIEHAAGEQRWRAAEGNVRVVGSGPVTVAYDLSDAARAKVVATVELPFHPARLLSIRLPMRQDRSWNGLMLHLEAGGEQYTLEDPLYLGQRRWQEFSFRLKHKDDRDERDVGIWPLVRAADEAVDAHRHGSAVAPRQARLTLTIDRASTVEAAGRKYASNYVAAYLASGQRWRYVRNSLYLVALTVIGQILSCSMVAYAFARLRWPGRDVLFLVLLATMMLPAQVTMVPTFVIYKYLGWYNTLKALWIPSFFGSAFFIFMLRQFMKSIPRELEEAARIDGCGYFGIYWQIILPVMKPALAAVGIFTFMGTWNDFMGPLIYINDERLYPLSLGLFDFRMQHGAEYGMLMAASTLMTLPVIAIFFLAQRYFIQGISLTGMKA